MATVVRTHVFCDVHLRSDDEEDAAPIVVGAGGAGIPEELAGSYTVDLCPKCLPDIVPALTELLTFAHTYGRPEKDSTNGSKRAPRRQVAASKTTKQLPAGSSAEKSAAAKNGAAKAGIKSKSASLQCEEPGCTRAFEGPDAARRRGAHAFRAHGRRSQAKKVTTPKSRGKKSAKAT